MNAQTKPLMDWAIQKIRKEYPEDVALLVAIDAHSVNDDGHGECFDYFVPATEQGNALAMTFIVEGIGHDLYPRSWERTQRTATLDDPVTLCLGKARIVYSRSPEDEARFLAIKAQLFENLANPEFRYQKALERLNVAMDLYRTAMFEEEIHKLRQAVGLLHGYLTQAVFTLNGTFSQDWRNGRLPELAALPAKPEGFVEAYQTLLRAKSSNEIKVLAHRMVAETRRFIAGFQLKSAATTSPKDIQGLADWYQEISLWWRRLRFYCETGNADAAFLEACQLQSELAIMSQEFTLWDMDLLGVFDADDLAPLSHRATELEAGIVSAIEGHGGSIRAYDSLEAFLAENS